MSIYLDNAATTRVCPEAAGAALEAMTQRFGNPSSTHAEGREARNLLREARKTVAAALGASPEEIFFTSGGTEADNWALFSAMRRQRKGKIVTTAVEHDAVRRAAEELASRGCEVVFVPPEADGSVPLEKLEAAIDGDTALVSVMLVNNETGNILPVSELRALLRRKNSRALLHTDAVQGFLKVPFRAASLGADLISISAHKIHGPKGVGALYIRRGLHLPPLLYGGGQEEGLRSGTESLPLIAAFAAAVRAWPKESGIAALRDRLLEGLGREVPEARVLGLPQAPHIVALALPGYPSEVLLNYLDGKGICVSRGSACKRGRRSHVLEAMRLPPELIDGSLRVSFSRENTPEEVDALLQALGQAVRELHHTGK